MPLRLPELLVLFVVALLIFGPKKLPEMGAAIGRSLTAFRKGWQEISDSTSEDAEIMDRRAELKRLELEALDREIAAKKASLLTPGETIATVDGVTEYTDENVYHTSAEEYSEAPVLANTEMAYTTSEEVLPVEVATSVVEEQHNAISEPIGEEQYNAISEPVEQTVVSKHADEPKQQLERAEQTGAAS